MAQWKLSRRHPACVTCERPFEDGEAHFSRLEITAEGVERADVCRACWPETSDPDWIWWRARRQVATKKGLAVDWEVLRQVFDSLGTKAEELRAARAAGGEAFEGGGGVVEVVAPAEPVAREDGDGSEGDADEATDESAEAQADDAPATLDPIERLEQLRYLLSLLLIRKRRLMLVRAVRRGDGEALVLRRSRRQEQIEVRAFDLEPEQMETVRAELQRLFEGEALDGDANDGAGDDEGEGAAEDAPEAAEGEADSVPASAERD